MSIELTHQRPCEAATRQDGWMSRASASRFWEIGGFKKERLFYLIMPLEHINFYFISYWMSNIWSLWHTSLEETLFDKQQGILYMHFLTDMTAHTTAFNGPVVGKENSPNCKFIHHAGSIRWSKPLQLGALPPELRPAPNRAIQTSWLRTLVESNQWLKNGYLSLFS